MEAKREDIQYWVGFSFIPSVGRVRLGRLESHFGNLKDAWQAEAGELIRAGLDSSVARSVVSWRPRISPDDEM